MSTDGQSLAAHLDQLQAAGAVRVFRKTASGPKADWAQLAKLLREVDDGDVVATRLDRLARSTRDLLNVLASLAEREASFRSLGDAWADTTTPHERLMLTVLAGLAGLAELERGPCQRNLIGSSRKAVGRRVLVHSSWR